MKEKNKNIIIGISIFLFSLIICFAFLRPHYTHDTYNIAREGYIKYAGDRFIKEARPFSAMLNILASMVNLPIDTYMILSFLVSLVLLSISVVILYNILKQESKRENRRWNFMLLLVSYLIIFSYMAVEHILFLESCILGLSMLLTVLAIKVIIQKEKHAYLKAMLFLLLAVFSYQGSIGLFPILLMTYYFFIQPIEEKEAVKKTIITWIMYIIAMAATVMFVKIFFGGSRIQIGTIPIEPLHILTNLKQIVIDSLNVIPKYVHIGIIVLTCIWLLTNKNKSLKEKTKHIFQYLFIILVAIGICMAPIVLGSGLALQPRMCIAYGSTIGISFLVMLLTINQDSVKYKKTISYTIILIGIILNSSVYFVLTNQHIEVNKRDKQAVEKIEQIIEKYEEENQIKVTKIAGTLKYNNKKYDDDMIQIEEYTQRSLGSWALRDTVIFYTKRDMEIAPISRKQYIQYFGNKNWNEFSEEQVVIIGDTLYLCAY